MRKLIEQKMRRLVDVPKHVREINTIKSMVDNKLPDYEIVFKRIDRPGQDDPAWMLTYEGWRDKPVIRVGIDDDGWVVSLAGKGAPRYSTGLSAKSAASRIIKHFKK